MQSELLVTGCYRSGTTLLEKLLHVHPSVCVASQPFPILYSFAKATFDAARGIERRYPLSHRFLEDAYTDADLAAFLDEHELTVSDLDSVFEALAAYTDGLWTPEILSARGAISPGRFLEVYRQLLAFATSVFPKQELRVAGSKEILVEEFVPYLLARGVRALIIVRDPRDLIASLNFRVRDNATGSDRPVLYSVRAWRKSVATVLAFEGHPGFRWLRYEDLVGDPQAVMAELARFLGLPPFPLDAFRGGLRDQRGSDWRGNSSFHDQRGVSGASVGMHRDALPAPVRALIEAAAAPEMAALGYSGAGFARGAITGYRDPFASIHAKFPADYSNDPARVRDELDRWTYLTGPVALSEADAARWFLYPEAYRRLRKAAGGGVS